MSNILDKINSVEMSRRTFLKWVSVLSAGAMVNGFENELHAISAEETTEILEKQGEWKNAACWHNCGGRCVIKAYVSDGRVLRLKTDDTHEDSADYPQQRACVRGRAQRMQVLGADRLKYPMKRKHFDPKGVKGKDLRGKDAWVRITWDEALDTVAEQLKKAKKNYGNKSIYLVDGGEMKRTISLFGGYAEKYGSRSRGAWDKAMKPILGISQKSHALNDRMDLLNAKLIVLWGCNPAMNAMGMPMVNLMRAKKKGIKFIVLDPMYTNTAAVLADEYIPIRPATDTTMLLAMAYVMITEDKKPYNLIDWDFLNRCTVGFDSEHMPEDVDKNENFMDYVLGTFDKEPKTPEWASKICGVSAKKIRSFALELARSKPATVLFGWNSARVEKAQHVCLAQMTLGAMTGNMGIKGGAFAVSAQEPSTNGGPNLVKAGNDLLPEIKNPLTGPKLCTNEHWEAILTNKYTDGIGEKKDVDIRVIYHSHSSTLNQTNNTNKGIRAHRKVDFVVTNQYVLNPNAAYSDIVLPVTTPWETEGTVLTGNREILIWTSNVIKPIFEARSDMWIAKELAKRLDIDPNKIEPISEKQRIFNQIAGAKVVCENGKDFENLVSISKEDLKAMGAEGQPQDGRIPIMEIKKKGIYQVPRNENDNHVYIHNKKFREDPENNPLDTESGKIEIYCKSLADMVTKAGWNEGIPIAKYVPPTEGYEATFSDFKKNTKGKYPLQLCNIHGLRHTHSIMGNVPWLREAFPYQLLISRVDAKARGLSEDDTVRVFNDNGSVIRRIHITERVMPGVVFLYEGPWVELDDDGNCLAGSPNVLTGDYPSGPNIESWQACIVEIEKHVKPLELDHKWEQRIVL